MKKSVASLVSETAIHGFSCLLGHQPMNAALFLADYGQRLRRELREIWGLNLKCFQQISQRSDARSACSTNSRLSAFLFNRGKLAT